MLDLTRLTFGWSLDGNPARLEGPLVLSVLQDAARWAIESGLELSRITTSESEGEGWLLGEALRRVSGKLGLPYVEGQRLSGDLLVGGQRASEIVSSASETPAPGRVDISPFTMKSFDGWVTVSRCGTWKDSRIKKVFDERYGEHWRMGYTWRDQLYSVRDGIDIYEDAYVEVFRADQELLAWVTSFRDVYDTAPSNVEAWLDYGYQEVEGAGQHWQDVAVRRALRRLGRWFQGTELLEIRGQESHGYRLNPGQLGFVWPDQIEYPAQSSWWRPGSIEDFSVSNYAVQCTVAAVNERLSAGLASPEEQTEIFLCARSLELAAPLARFAAVGARQAMVAARVLSLLTESQRQLMTERSPELGAWRATAQELASLPREQLKILDDLFSPDPLTRALGFDVLVSSDFEQKESWIRLVLEDPARSMRHKARTTLGIK